MLVPILLGIAAVIAVLVIVIALQPSDFGVARSGTIAAPPEVVFPHVNDLHAWTAWSPWEKLDPNMEKTYEGPDAGKGASYAWNGDKNVGEGKMTITESVPNQRIEILLEFKKPMNVTNDTEFIFTPEGNGTKVDWRMSGKNNFMGKAFGLVMNMDKMVGGQFEQGLADLKAVCESETAQPHS